MIQINECNVKMYKWIHKSGLNPIKINRVELTLVRPGPECEGDLEAPADRPAGGGVGCK